MNVSLVGQHATLSTYAPRSTPAAAGTATQATSQGGACGVVGSQIDSSGSGSGADPVRISVKQSLEAMGFTAEGTGLNRDLWNRKIDEFSQAIMGSAHDAMQGSGATSIDGSPLNAALNSLADKARAGNAPQTLRNAFDTLTENVPADGPTRQQMLGSLIGGVRDVLAHPLASYRNAGGAVDATA